MNIHLENVNLDSTSGPNSFGQKLVKYISNNNFTEFETADITLIQDKITNYRTLILRRPTRRLTV